MNALAHFIAQLTPAQQALFESLDSPAAIQAWLDRTPYSTDAANLCPLAVLTAGVAHCLDGALFAAAALRRLGHPPLLIDLLPEPGQDDDHVLAIYRSDGHIGAVAKSNYPGLRAREPIYRNLRELALSYFPWYFNSERQKTLRGYTRPLHLAALDRQGWMWDNAGADAVEQRLQQLRPIPLLRPTMIARLQPLDDLSYAAGSVGVNPAGVYRPAPS